MTPAFTQENEEGSAPITNEEVENIREYQYVLKFKSLTSDNCYYMVFENRNESHMSIMILDKDYADDNQFFITNNDDTIRKSGRRYYYEKIYEGMTKGHVYRVEKGELIARYKKKLGESFFIEEMTLVENVSCP